MENKPACQFFADNERHCVINEDCIVCREPNGLPLQKNNLVKFSAFGCLDGWYGVDQNSGGVLKLNFLRDRQQNQNYFATLSKKV